jgi:hypothetical protein
MVWLILVVVVVAYLWRTGNKPFDKTLEVGAFTVPSYSDWSSKRNVPPGGGGGV